MNAEIKEKVSRVVVIEMSLAGARALVQKVKGEMPESSVRGVLLKFADELDAIGVRRG